MSRWASDFRRFGRYYCLHLRIQEVQEEVIFVSANCYYKTFRIYFTLLKTLSLLLRMTNNFCVTPCHYCRFKIQDNVSMVWERLYFCVAVSVSSFRCCRFPGRDHRPFGPCFLRYRPPSSGTRGWLLRKYQYHEHTYTQPSWSQNCRQHVRFPSHDSILH
jgi:hypothetical protein